MSDSTIPPIKRCTKCTQEYPATLEYFSRAKLGHNGLNARCKICDHAYYALNRERIIKRGHERYERKRDEIIAYNRARYIPTQRIIVTTPERVKAQKDKYNLSHRAENRERVARSRSKNPATRIAEKQRRRANEKNVASSFTAQDWRDALSYFDNRCAVCGRPRGLWHTLAADHWIPLSSPDCPGTIPANIIPLCHGIDGCNNKKANKHPEQWLNEQFGKARTRTIMERIESYFKHLSASPDDEP